MSDVLDQLRYLLARATPAQRRAMFDQLRAEFGIHPLEQEWNTTAEAILEAIQRSPALTQRGVRGILADASFYTSALPPLLRIGWNDVTPNGDVPYDAAIQDNSGIVHIQVKLQRSKNRRPMRGDEVSRQLRFAAEMFVVETQKTRAGKRGGKDTRPYRFGDFDVLAVSLAPSTTNWGDFLFTVADWLIPDPTDRTMIYKYQPVPPAPNADWSDDLATCIGWFRAASRRTVGRTP